LVGDGPMRGELERLAAGLGVGETVHFAGYQDRPEQFLRLMDVFALTSRMEGLPLAILEAWAAGLPVVASSVGGVPDLIDHGRNGLLFPSGDEAALTDQLGGLLDHPIRARALGGAGRDVVRERYSLERMAGDYDRHYRYLLGSRAHQLAACAT
jgi:glycosyltransferase involved in cell wall biosynthesis